MPKLHQSNKNSIKFFYILKNNIAQIVQLLQLLQLQPFDAIEVKNLLNPNEIEPIDPLDLESDFSSSFIQNKSL